ncbi:hypothetical protein LTR78_007440 [Recurvomyces mirabilis]|uniref:Uncharacterized protein n=1 Tax=Recurvomyces mirabilis TaxID=574656 RepID=A0AAE0TVE5_9PEZI|nr:hypothetical protein LTR78_007440 [Recurvomyces mirabilis]KAK5160051.1 hypothetical protein LTS14_002157 [Recurvomyces mirabilis]
MSRPLSPAAFTPLNQATIQDSKMDDLWEVSDVVGRRFCGDTVQYLVEWCPTHVIFSELQEFLYFKIDGQTLYQSVSGRIHACSSPGHQPATDMDQKPNAALGGTSGTAVAGSTRQVYTLPHHGATGGTMTYPAVKGRHSPAQCLKVKWQRSWIPEEETSFIKELVNKFLNDFIQDSFNGLRMDPDNDNPMISFGKGFRYRWRAESCDALDGPTNEQGVVLSWESIVRLNGAL